MTARFSPLPAPLARARIDLAGEADRAAMLAWAAHLAAGRLGAPAPAPPPGEYRLASLERLLGRAPAGGAEPRA